MSSSSSSDDDISNTTTGTEAAAGAPHASSKERDSAFVVTSKTDTQHVAMLRLVVGLVLICSAVGVALSTNFYITDSENDQFKTQFKDDSEKVLQAIGSRYVDCHVHLEVRPKRQPSHTLAFVSRSLDKTLGLLDGLAVSLVSMARYGNQTWPCVSMPNLAVRMAKLLPLTDAVNINILPIVTPSTRAKWEDYTLHHGGWVDEAVAVQAKWEDYYGPVIYNGEHSHVIHGDFEDIPLNTTYVSCTISF
jgi:hypothetical protein